MFTIENKIVLLVIILTILFSVNYTVANGGGEGEKTTVTFGMNFSLKKSV